MMEPSECPSLMRASLGAHEKDGVELARERSEWVIISPSLEGPAKSV